MPFAVAGGIRLHGKWRKSVYVRFGHRPTLISPVGFKRSNVYISLKTDAVTNNTQVLELCLSTSICKTVCNGAMELHQLYDRIGLDLEVPNYTE